MCAGDNNVLAFPSNFIDNLLGTSSQQWIQQLKHNEIDLFSHNMLVMPFQSEGQKSLFVVVGAKHIKDYMRIGLVTHGHASFTFFHKQHLCGFRHMHTIKHV